MALLLHLLPSHFSIHQSSYHDTQLAEFVIQVGGSIAGSPRLAPLPSARAEAGGCRIPR
jgi:hypothetical protein